MIKKVLGLSIVIVSVAGAAETRPEQLLNIPPLMLAQAASYLIAQGLLTCPPERSQSEVLAGIKQLETSHIDDIELAGVQEPDALEDPHDDLKYGKCSWILRQYAQTKSLPSDIQLGYLVEVTKTLPCGINDIFWTFVDLSKDREPDESVCGETEKLAVDLQRAILNTVSFIK